MNSTPERWAAAMYGLAALAVAGIWFIMVFAANPPNVTPGDMLRAFLVDSSHRVFYWWLAVVPALCAFLAVAYLTPLVRRRRFAIVLWVAGVSLALATWFTPMPPAAFFATLAVVLVASFTEVPFGEIRTPKCPVCAQHLSRRRIAMTPVPHWLSCQSCKAPLVGDKFVRLLSIAGAIFLWVWLAFSVGAMHLLGDRIGDWLLFIGALLCLVAWPISLFLTCRYGSYLERKPTGAWWTVNLGQWARAHIYNIGAFAGCALLVFMVWAIVDQFYTTEGGPLWAVIVASPFFDALLGFAAFFVFRGHPFVRVALVAAVCVAASLMYYVTLGSPRPENPDQVLEYAVLGAVIFMVGAAFATILTWLRDRGTARPAI